MKIKIENILGHNLYMKIKQVLKYIRDVIKNKKRIVIKSKKLSIKIFQEKNKHVFFGYYDIPQINKSETKMLVHIVPKKANASNDKAEIGFYNLENFKYSKMYMTRAWSWQQGSRLRWWPNDDNYIIFNDIDGNNYVCKKLNINTNKVEKVFCRALYDIDCTGTYGLSLNFSRLQRLRPGYGYSSLPDFTKDYSMPKNDGIFYVDLVNNKEHLLISLFDLAKKCNCNEFSQHYVNHISISPNGKKFLFFHIWTLPNKKWETQLCVMDKTGKNLQILESVNQVSHYDWIDSNRIIVTGYMPNRKQIYSIYDIDKKTKEILNYDCLDKDGHPTILKGHKKFISDTYPKKYDIQTLFKFDMENKKYQTLLEIYSSPLMYEEKRCDLHPRVSKTEKYITIDTTFENNCRKIILIKDWKE